MFLPLLILGEMDVDRDGPAMIGDPDMVCIK
jgi:hypothetical protein